MKIILTSVETGLLEAWTSFCGDLDFVTIHHGSILDLACDAVVSPANSFGFMDGGIDALYSDRFGWTVQKRLQRLIADRHRGELLVGTAEIVETDYLRLPFLIAAPTMRVPMILGRETVTPYLATRATLLLIGNGIFPEGQHAGEQVSAYVESVAFPGMGTGVGKVPFEVCARQVRAAIDDVLLKKFYPPVSWAEASERHQLLYSNRTKDLQY